MLGVFYVGKFELSVSAEWVQSKYRVGTESVQSKYIVSTGHTVKLHNIYK